jgi:membrane protein DedA with SNARE-associated domain
MSQVATPTPNRWRKIAPQLIVAAIIIAIVAYIVIQILEDVLLEGTPISSEPIIGAIFTFINNVPDTVRSWGYIGVFVLMLLESSSLPVPSEVVLPVAGVLVSMGDLNLWLTIAVATVAGVAGSLIDYFIGLKGVHLLMEHKILGKAVFSTRQLETAAHWFNKRGSIMVFIARFVPGIRTLISFPAGAVKMSMPKFLVYTTIGCLLWNALLIYAGVYLKDNWREVAGVLHYILIAVVIVAAIIFAYYIFNKKRKEKNQKTA